jgi:hypothetical protein
MNPQRYYFDQAGGTGGHTEPGRGGELCARVAGACTWLGGKGQRKTPNMEKPVTAAWLCLWVIDFSGVRGKGLLTLAFPAAALPAPGSGKAYQVIRRVKLDVVVGLGGFLSNRHDERAANRSSANKIPWPAWSTNCWPVAICVLLLSTCAEKCRMGGQSASTSTHCNPDPTVRFCAASGCWWWSSLGATALNRLFPRRC